jgi:hypothetical protein
MFWFPASTGCQPVLFGSLPKALARVSCGGTGRRRRQVADDYRLAACAPRTFCSRAPFCMIAFELHACFALSLTDVTRF